MNIDYIRIQGYRSVADLELRPQAFTVLVGPNNSGKSNIVDAIDFLADVYRSGVKLAIDRKGGFDHIAFRHDGKATNEIRFDTMGTSSLAELEQLDSFGSFMRKQRGEYVPDGNIVFRHSFVVAGRGQSPISEYEVAKETLRIDYSASDGSSSELVSVERHGTIVTAIGGMSHPATRLVLPNYLANGTGSLQQLLQLLFSPLEFVSDRLRLISPAFGEFAQHMARAKAFQLVAPECRKSAAPTPFAEMQSSGRNLPALVYHLREHFPLSWEKVMRNMAFIVPDLVEIDVQPTQDRLWTLRFSEADTQQEWTVSEVSDGTIRSLALFAAAFDPRSSLIAVEEPENSVHPWILRVFVDICRQVSGSDIEPRKQILVTTHSPVLIDHLEPSEISMVWREQGRTQLRPLTELEPHLVDDWREGNVSLFEVLDSGLLRQAVPTA